MASQPHGSAGADERLWIFPAYETLRDRAQAASRLVSEAQGMCTDEAPHEEINVVLDKAQRALDGVGGSTA